jgi:hypothetical protein
MNLPNITLVAIDRVAHELTEMALNDTLRFVKPEAILIWSDKSIVPKGDHEQFYVPPGDMESYNKILWHEVPQKVQTSHFITIEWDGWITNPSMWRDEFLKYDYIGAPWHFHPNLKVGNGGFSLRSKKLGMFLSEHKVEFPPRHPEDDALCRRYRQEIEKFGFTWAPLALAQTFSYEYGKRPQGTFGFHSCENWHHYITREEITERLKFENDYLKNKITWQQMKATYNK